MKCHQQQVEEEAAKLYKKATACLNDEVGYKAGEVIRDFFWNNTDHDYPTYILEREGINRRLSQDHTTEFAKSLARLLAHQEAENIVIAKNGYYN